MPERDAVVIKGSTAWMWFIRGSVGLIWLVGQWAVRTLLLINDSQKLQTQLISSMMERMAKVESRIDKRDEDERNWLRSNRGSSRDQ